MSTATATQEAPSENTGLRTPPGAVKNVPLDKPGDKKAQPRSDRKFRGVLGNSTSLEVVSAQHLIEASDGDTVDDITNPAYWSNVAGGMIPNTFIYVRMNGEDNRLLLLFVVDCGPLWAAVRILDSYDLTDAAQAALGLHLADATNDFDVVHKGGAQKWVVLRKSDKQVMHKGLPDRAAANAWITEYQKTLTR